MSNINLFKSVQEKEEATKTIKMGGKAGFFLPFSFLMLVLLIYGGLLFYTKIVKGEAEKIKEQISVETKNLSSKDINRVADFKERLDNIEKENKNKSYPNDFFDQFRNLIVQGGQASDLTYAPDSATVNIVCDNFSTVAKQVLSFKGSDFFSDSRVDKIARNQDGKIILTLTSTFKK